MDMKIEDHPKMDTKNEEKQNSGAFFQNPYNPPSEGLMTPPLTPLHVWRNVDTSSSRANNITHTQQLSEVSSNPFTTNHHQTY
jgi:hypothetical protein